MKKYIKLSLHKEGKGANYNNDHYLFCKNKNSKEDFKTKDKSVKILTYVWVGTFKVIMHILCWNKGKRLHNILKYSVEKSKDF